MFHSFRSLVITFLFSLSVVSCGGGSSSGNAPSGVTTSPSPPPVVTPAPPQMVLTGVAAVGAALDGALIEVIDAAGNLVDIGDAATGTDGSYSVVLPSDIALPVVIRATPPGGTPLLSIVQAPADGSTEVVANINPVTNLVSGAVLGTGSGSSDGDIAGALAAVDPTTIDASGDAIIQKVFGASVDYDAFATDPDFVAADGTSSGSAADAVLDTVARRAADAGTTIEETLSLFNEAENPPALLEDPSFQVELVSELVKGGSDSAALETQLSGIGALGEAADGEPDVFRTIIAVVPAVIATTRTDTASVTTNEDLVNAAVDASVKVISSTINKKKTRFAATATDLNNLLNSPTFQSTTTKVVAAAIGPVLSAASASSDVAGLLTTVSSVSNSIAEEASEVVSGFGFDTDSADVSDLVTGFVTATVTANPITTETLQGISAGTMSASDVVSDSGDVSTVQTNIVNFATQNPDLVNGDVAETIQVIPKGVWGESTWGSFNWG